MKRRDFTRLLGGAALAWPMVARALQAARLYRVGWLFAAVPLKDMGGSDPVDPVSRAFVHGLRDLGILRGRIWCLIAGLRRGSLSGLASAQRNSWIRILT
jgi:putative ABC transport system substrate-binding protein